MESTNRALSVNADTATAATLKELTTKLGELMTERLEEGSLLRSVSHAFVPAAEPNERWSLIAVFTTVGEGDNPNPAEFTTTVLSDSEGIVG